MLPPGVKKVLPLRLLATHTPNNTSAVRSGTALLLKLLRGLLHLLEKRYIFFVKITLSDNGYISQTQIFSPMLIFFYFQFAM